MGELLERIKLDIKVYGKGDLPSTFKANSMYLYEKYSKSDDYVMSIPFGKMQMGGFYFFHYKDDSNWMQYSPVFTIEFKRFDNMIVVMAINFNFIPLEIRSAIFDNFIKKDDFENNALLPVDFQGVYAALLKYGFEYAIVEYNVAQLVAVHKIHMELVPRFLYSQHPINKYDPYRLYDIWIAKIPMKSGRHAEISQASIDEFYKINNDVLTNYDLLKDHITRLQNSYIKYGQ